MKKILSILSCVLIVSCGFHLRGVAPLPYKSIYVATGDLNVARNVKRQIESSSKTIVPERAADAEAILHIIRARNSRHILSVSGSGRVREFQLRYQLGFRVTDSKGQEIIPANFVNVSRILPYSDQQVLSKQAEEAMLVREMKKDAVRQMIHRIGKAK